MAAPDDAKGTVPKPIHQARTYRRMGWDCERLKSYSVPKTPGYDIDPGAWKHVGDALGLALWGYDMQDTGTP